MLGVSFEEDYWGYVGKGKGGEDVFLGGAEIEYHQATRPLHATVEKGREISGCEWTKVTMCTGSPYILSL